MSNGSGWGWYIGIGAAVAAGAAVVAWRPHWIGLKPTPAPAKPVSPQPAQPKAAATPTAPTAPRTTALPLGQHVEAQYGGDGRWYGATLQKVDLADPDAVRWDAGTVPATANPRTGTSPALAVRAVAPSPLAAIGPVAPLPKPAAPAAPPPPDAPATIAEATRKAAQDQADFEAAGQKAEDLEGMRLIKSGQLDPSAGLPATGGEETR